MKKVFLKDKAPVIQEASMLDQASPKRESLHQRPESEVKLDSKLDKTRLEHASNALSKPEVLQQSSETEGELGMKLDDHTATAPLQQLEHGMAAHEDDRKYTDHPSKACAESSATAPPNVFGPSWCPLQRTRMVPRSAARSQRSVQATSLHFSMDGANAGVADFCPWRLAGNSFPESSTSVSKDFPKPRTIRLQRSLSAASTVSVPAPRPSTIDLSRPQRSPTLLHVNTFPAPDDAAVSIERPAQSQCHVLPVAGSVYMPPEALPFFGSDCRKEQQNSRGEEGFGHDGAPSSRESHFSPLHESEKLRPSAGVRGTVVGQHSPAMHDGKVDNMGSDQASESSDAVRGQSESQAGSCKSQMLTLADSAVGLWQQPANSTLRVGACPFSDVARNRPVDRIGACLKAARGSGEWQKSVSDIFAKRPKGEPSLASAIAVRSCDPAVVHAGYLGAPTRQLRSSASLPSIRRLAPPMTISSSQAPALDCFLAGTVVR